MSCWALIPFKGFDRGKSRLSSVLPPSERVALARRLFDHVVKLAHVTETERFAEATPDLVSAILTEAGKMCEEVLHPRVYHEYRAVMLPDWLVWSAEPSHPLMRKLLLRLLTNAWTGDAAHPAVDRARASLEGVPATDAPTDAK